MNIFRRSIVAGAAALALGSAALAANIPLVTGVQEPNQLAAIINALTNQINALVTPNTMATYATGRNYLDNGAMQISQRGTGLLVGAANAGIVSANYVADRWAVQTNVGSGDGRGQVITATPAPPPGFTRSMKVVRNSGALLQPVCVIQEIPSIRATQLAGQFVTFSMYGQALAGFTAASNLVSATVIWGTGTDEGLGTPTASPAVTPAWTGITSIAAGSFNLTTAWVRYTGAAVLIPTTATEIGVELCFTPVGSSSGTTDGFAFVGAQLEQGSSASPFEFRPVGDELREMQRYYFSLAEAAATVVQSPVGTALGTTTTCTTEIPFQVPMRVAPTFAPVPSPLTASTFKIVSASQAATALGTPFAATLGANTPTAASINFTTTGMTAKDSCYLVGAAGGSALTWSADF